MLLKEAFDNLKNLERIVFLPASRLRPSGEPDLSDGLDFSNTFGMILSAMQACDLHPEEIDASNSNNPGRDFYVEKFDVFAPLVDIFRTLAVLRLGVAGHDNASIITWSDLNYTKWLVAALQQMQSLRTLTLAFHDYDGQSEAFITAASRSVNLPSLRNLTLNGLFCQMHDLIQFLRIHAPTLECCGFSTLGVVTGGEMACRDLLAALSSNAFNLDVFAIGTLFDADICRFDFSAIDCTKVSSEPNEDG